MLKQIRDGFIEQVRQRVSEGDCPTTPALSVETLENIVMDLAPSHTGEREAVARIDHTTRSRALVEQWLETPLVCAVAGPVATPPIVEAIRVIVRSLRPSDDGDARSNALEEAAQELLDTMSGTYKARNGREMGIQGDDGEKCWIVHSDQIEGLRRALAPSKGINNEG